MNLQFVEGDYWRQKARSMGVREFEISAVRGNIYDVNGNLLATSLPYYEVAMDVTVPSSEDFAEKA
ncbi:MAG: hypothetical protein IAF38_06015, partial [Bacteroidia bacterium]|nr:hypothetical protein [Bacteroidia bacterium]